MALNAEHERAGVSVDRHDRPVVVRVVSLHRLGVVHLIEDPRDCFLLPVARGDARNAQHGGDDQRNENDQRDEEEGPVWRREVLSLVGADLQQGSVGQRTELAVCRALVIKFHDRDDHQLSRVSAVRKHINTGLVESVHKVLTRQSDQLLRQCCELAKVKVSVRVEERVLLVDGVLRFTAVAEQDCAARRCTHYWVVYDAGIWSVRLESTAFDCLVVGEVLGDEAVFVLTTALLIFLLLDVRLQLCAAFSHGCWRIEVALDTASF